MKLRFSPEAFADLAATVEHVRHRNPEAARQLATRVFEALDQLAAQDFDGPQQSLTTGEVVRSWPVHPLRIYYQRTRAELIVLRIYHQARRPIAR